jgi:hypothetical protein
VRRLLLDIMQFYFSLIQTLGQAPPTSRVAVLFLSTMHWYIVRSKTNAYVKASTSYFTCRCSVSLYNALIHSTSNFTCCFSVSLYDALVHCAKQKKAYVKASTFNFTCRRSVSLYDTLVHCAKQKKCIH